jgi:septal ring factor EnvC (AmiA/AmiB activator)
VRAFEQAECALQKATSRAADADEQNQCACGQIEQYEEELANVRAKLEAKESELEAVRLRLADAEKGLTRSKAEPGRHITHPDC